MHSPTGEERPGCRMRSSYARQQPHDTPDVYVDDTAGYASGQLR